MRRRALFVLCGLATIAAAFVPFRSSLGQSPLGNDIEILDPSGRALSAFHASLARRQGTRVMVWGASHTSEDRFTGYLRTHLQARYGDGGPGFVLPARPFTLYGHQTVRIAESGAWRTLRVRGRRRTPDRYGPAGFAIETARRAHAFLEAEVSIERARVFFLEQPRGGHFDVRTESGQAQTISTRGDRVRSITLDSPAFRRLDLRTRGDGPVRIFGVSLEREPNGLIVDAMGSPGARMRDRLPWDDAAMRRQLRELAPDLVVLAYGTNESGFRGRPIARYRADVDEALRRVRAMNPGASCLVIGPSDWPERTESGFVPRPRIGRVIAVQREMAARHGCGHFDLVAWQGGPMSMPSWVAAGLAERDHIHFTDAGHRRLAQALASALLRGQPSP